MQFDHAIISKVMYCLLQLENILVAPLCWHQSERDVESQVWGILER